MKKLIKNTVVETYCLRHCCQDTSKRAVHAEGGAVSINTKVKSENTEITDARNHRHMIAKRIGVDYILAGCFVLHFPCVS